MYFYKTKVEKKKKTRNNNLSKYNVSCDWFFLCMCYHIGIQHTSGIMGAVIIHLCFDYVLLNFFWCKFFFITIVIWNTIIFKEGVVAIDLSIIILIVIELFSESYAKLIMANSSFIISFHYRMILFYFTPFYSPLIIPCIRWIQLIFGKSWIEFQYLSPISIFCHKSWIVSLIRRSFHQ